MATHSTILAWEIPWTEEPGRVQSVGLQSRTRLSAHKHKLLMDYHSHLYLCTHLHQA